MDVPLSKQWRGQWRTEETGGRQSTGLQSVGQDSVMEKNKQQQRQVQRAKFLEIGKCYIYSKMDLGWIRENTILLFFLLEIQNNHSFLKKKKKKSRKQQNKTSCIYCVPDTMLTAEDTLIESSNLCPQRAHSIVVRTGFLKEQEMRIHNFIPWQNFSL